MEISVCDLTKVYKGRVKALDGVDLSVTRGMFGLLGPNGAGKTTLMRILVGLVRPTSGRVFVGGEDVTREPGRTRVRRRLGYLPQEFGLYPDLTARQFLDYMAVLKEIHDGAARRLAVEQALEMVRLSEVANRRIREFSGGMKRRLGIAQALLNDPQLLIVDEPTVGLDPEERIRFRNLLADLAGDRVVILSTHIVEDVSHSCRELAVLCRGRILYQGPVDRLVAEAQGSVWEVELPATTRLPAGAAVTSTVHVGATVRYRFVAGPGQAETGISSLANVRPAMPTLEEAYVWLMQTRQDRPTL